MKNKISNDGVGNDYGLRCEGQGNNGDGVEDDSDDGEHSNSDNERANDNGVGCYMNDRVEYSSDYEDDLGLC